MTKTATDPTPQGIQRASRSVEARRVGLPLDGLAFRRFGAGDHAERAAIGA